MTVAQYSVNDSFDNFRKLFNETCELEKRLSKTFYGIQPEMSDITKALKEIQWQLDNPTPVTIALLGSTGAGKSTLINTLIGSEILPNSGINVCTSGITRVKYSDSAGFKITVKFSTVESWKQELENALREISSDFSQIESDENLKPAENLTEPESKEAVARILAIYGRDSYQRFIANHDLKELVMPTEVAKAFSETTRVINVASPREVLKEVNFYLVTQAIEEIKEDSGRLWPIVESVLIEGRFEAIKHGAEIVDLPGINDPNEAREAKTREYLSTAKFIFVAYESKRQPTKDIYDILKTRDLRNNIVASGKTGALTFIATKSDSFTPSDQDFLSLGEKVTMDAKARFRKTKVNERLQGALKDISVEVGRICESQQDTEMVIDTISNSPRFVTSAYNFSLHMAMLAGEEVEEKPRFKNIEDTDIQRLRSHIERITIKDGPQVVFSRLVNELKGVTNRMLLMLNLEFARFVMREEKHGVKIKELQSQVNSITEELNASIEKLSTSLDESIAKQVDDFFLKINFDARTIIRVRDKFSRDIQNLHWATLRATTARGGRFWSPTFGEIDLIAGVSQPITDAVTGPWASFFGESIKTTLEILSERFSDIAKTYIENIDQLLHDEVDFGDVDTVVKSLLTNLSEVSQSKLQATNTALSDEVKATRSQLIELIRETVEKQMRPVIIGVSDERGTGMKYRMTSQIVESTLEIIPNTFDAVKVQIIELVNDSMKKIDTLTSEISKVIHNDSLRIQEIFASPKELDKVFDPVEFESNKNLIEELVAQTENLTLVLEPTISSGETENSPSRRYLYLDGSNVATSPISDTKKRGSLERLTSCEDALSREFPDAGVIVFVDANFKFLLPEPERKELEIRLLNGTITEAPGGETADVIMLGLAARNGGAIVSGDRFRDWKISFPLIAENGRIIAPTYVAPTKQWIFRPRNGQR